MSGPRKPPKQRNRGRNVEWGTPQWLFDWADREYGPFDVDVCATPENAKCEHFYTEADDGLAQRWSYGPCITRIAWCNPPYADVDAWVRKALAASLDNVSTLMLLPANTGTAWWQECVSQAAEIVFLRKKFAFDGAAHNSPFYCVLVLFEKRKLLHPGMRFVDPRTGDEATYKED